MSKPLELQRKHLTKAEMKIKEIQEEIITLDNGHLNNPPDWLINDVAKKEWKRLVEEFNKKSLISNLDYNNLGAYCNAFARYIELSKQIKLEFMEGMDINPLIPLELKYSDEMKRYGALLGLTIESRLKLGRTKSGELQKNLDNRFGEV